MSKKSDNITWFQYNNIVSIVVSALMLAGSFYAQKADLALLKQDVGYIKDNISNVSELGKDNSALLNNHETRITLLEKSKVSQKPSNTSVAFQVTPSVIPIPQKDAVKSSDESAKTNINIVQSDNKSESKETAPSPNPSPIKKVVESVVSSVQNLVGIKE